MYIYNKQNMYLHMNNKINNFDNTYNKYFKNNTLKDNQLNNLNKFKCQEPNNLYDNINNINKRNSNLINYKMGQRNAKIQQNGIYDIKNDIIYNHNNINNRYNNMTYNNNDIKPSNFNMNNIKILDEEEEKKEKENYHINTYHPYHNKNLNNNNNNIPSVFKYDDIINNNDYKNFNIEHNHKHINYFNSNTNNINNNNNNKNNNNSNNNSNNSNKFNLLNSAKNSYTWSDRFNIKNNNENIDSNKKYFDNIYQNPYRNNQNITSNQINHDMNNEQINTNQFNNIYRNNKFTKTHDIKNKQGQLGNNAYHFNHTNNNNNNNNNNTYNYNNNYNNNYNKNVDLINSKKEKNNDIDDIIKKYTTDKDNRDDNNKFNCLYANNDVLNDILRNSNNNNNINNNYSNNINNINNNNYSSNNKTKLFTFNSSSLRNKQKDDEEKKREKKLNLLKNIIVNNPNKKCNMSFHDDFYDSIAQDNFYINTSSIVDYNDVHNKNYKYNHMKDDINDHDKNIYKKNEHNNIYDKNIYEDNEKNEYDKNKIFNFLYDDLNILDKMNETPYIMNKHKIYNENIYNEQDNNIMTIDKNYDHYSYDKTYKKMNNLNDIDSIKNKENNFHLLNNHINIYDHIKTGINQGVDIFHTPMRNNNINNNNYEEDFYQHKNNNINNNINNNNNNNNYNMSVNKNEKQLFQFNMFENDYKNDANKYDANKYDAYKNDVHKNDAYKYDSHKYDRCNVNHLGYKYNDKGHDYYDENAGKISPFDKFYDNKNHINENNLNFFEQNKIGGNNGRNSFLKNSNLLFDDMDQYKNEKSDRNDKNYLSGIERKSYLNKNNNPINNNWKKNDQSEFLFLDNANEINIFRNTDRANDNFTQDNFLKTNTNIIEMNKILNKYNNDDKLNIVDNYDNNTLYMNKMKSTNNHHNDHINNN
ncbi:putative protein kinase, partial [Plasmodium gaboni]